MIRTLGFGRQRRRTAHHPRPHLDVEPSGAALLVCFAGLLLGLLVLGEALLLAASPPASPPRRERRVERLVARRPAPVQTPAPPFRARRRERCRWGRRSHLRQARAGDIATVDGAAAARGASVGGGRWFGRRWRSPVGGERREQFVMTTGGGSSPRRRYGPSADGAAVADTGLAGASPSAPETLRLPAGSARLTARRLGLEPDEAHLAAQQEARSRRRPARARTPSRRARRRPTPPSDPWMKLACFSDTHGGADGEAAQAEPVDQHAGADLAGHRVDEHRAGVLAAGLVLAPPAHDLGQLRLGRVPVAGHDADRAGRRRCRRR